jgi:Zn-dependent peptidase ImmA (M78 family)/transcriptional regulator with XRE-family HTH domain
MIGDNDLFSAAHSFEPARLTLARELRGMTKTQLAARVEKTPSAISQFEAGAARPDPETMGRLAQVLAVPLAFFAPGHAAPTTELISIESCHFRSLRSATQRDRRRMLAGGALLCDLATSLSKLVQLPTDRVTPIARAPHSTDDIEVIASEVRAAWSLGLGPVADVIKLLENNGVLVFRIWQDCHEIDAFSLRHNGRPCVFLNLYKDSPTRTRFDAAHELGHLVMHAAAPVGKPDIEAQANRFASAFLMPRDSFLLEAPRRISWPHLVELKRRWKVSLKALVRRLRDLDCIGDATYRRANVQWNARYNAGGVFRGEEAEPPAEAPYWIPKVLGGLEARQQLDALAERLGLTAADTRALVADGPAAIQAEPAGD